MTGRRHVRNSADAEVTAMNDESKAEPGEKTVTGSDPQATVSDDQQAGNSQLAGSPGPPQQAVDPFATVAEPAAAAPPPAPAVDSNATVADPDATLAQPVPRQPAPNRQTETLPQSALAETASDSSTGSLTSEGRRFRIVREHARGGLGQLFVAEDAELNREVALKELLSHCADDTESRYRFLREAEITGALEHPGIAPVYGLGQYADGRPYYAMRFIRGNSLQDAISRFHDPSMKLGPGQRSVEMRRLLRNFVSVCQSLHYAHVRGVLHRDLKPANVMLGDHGETLVVDWGLATTVDLAACENAAERPVEPVISDSMIGDVPPTQVGSAVGTPAYMSPEQAGGNVDQLGPATDVYGLGATLFHLLTGQPPFDDRELSVILGKVCRGEFAPPISLDRRIPPPLNAICLAAMARNPEDRYASADLLAKDVEQWLADEPVSMWTEPLRVRLGRWMRRHRTIVTSAAAALGVAVLALVMGVILLTAAHDRERRARSEAQRAFKTARTAVDRYYVKASENVLLNQPGMQGLRRELLRDALDYYQRFLDEHHADPAVQEELAATHFYVGQLREDLNSPADAIPCYTAAIELQRRLLAQRPGDPSHIDALADSLNARGRALDRMQKQGDALANFEEAARLRGDLVRRESANDEFRRKQANTYMNLGLVARKRKELTKAQTLYDKAQTIREGVLHQTPSLTSVRRDLGKGYYNQAVVEMVLKDLPAAQTHFEQAIKAFQQVVEETPQDLKSQSRLALCYRLLGDVRAAASEIEAAREMFDEAESRFEQLAYHNPDVPEFSAGLAGVLMNRGNLDAKVGGAESIDSARERFTKSRDILETLVSEHPSVASYQRDLAAVRSAIQRLDESLPGVNTGS